MRYLQEYGRATTRPLLLFEADRGETTEQDVETVEDAFRKMCVMES